MLKQFVLNKTRWVDSIQIQMGVRLSMKSSRDEKSFWRNLFFYHHVLIRLLKTRESLENLWAPASIEMKNCTSVSMVALSQKILRSNVNTYFVSTKVQIGVHLFMKSSRDEKSFWRNLFFCHHVLIRLIKTQESLENLWAPASIKIKFCPSMSKLGLSIYCCPISTPTLFSTKFKRVYTCLWKADEMRNPPFDEFSFLSSRTHQTVKKPRKFREFMSASFNYNQILYSIIKGNFISKILGANFFHLLSSGLKWVYLCQWKATKI